ncbi:alpha,alpha-trehalase TreA [Paraflavisolibacter sp. H34]|uniref:alpha,alpha-trehalase TreA n=1 Tax=Huijunlia imazamoxiresistens TaxID=3127457 RepID=UPI003018C109
MIRTLFLLFFLLSARPAFVQTVLTPDRLYGELFTAVQTGHIFPDNKTFVDCIPRKDPARILQAYRAARYTPGFHLKTFVAENFHLPEAPGADFAAKETEVTTHIHKLWNVLKRKSDSTVAGSSLLPLPHPYIVPGGRFREIYYWDSYFTLLGLKESGEDETITNMVRNFAFLIDTYGHIPNGNRTYYLSRSQPPFFSLMLDLLAEIRGPRVYTEHLQALQKEYRYWMDGTAPTRHVVKMPDGSTLNRYYDQLDIPRQEMYVADLETARAAKNRGGIYRQLRSAAESGWDFSSRWLADGRSLPTIRTTDLVPVDLNCLLYHLEQTLAKATALKGDSTASRRYGKLAEQRKAAINKYCWSARQGWYTDYNLSTKKHSPELSLAGTAPFFLEVAPAGRIFAAAENIRLRFLLAGGVVTTLKTTGQQWDAPNGWAPLQWMTITGLERYGQPALARTIAGRWIRLNLQVYARTGKLMEKYNVADTSLAAGGGEYPSQDGFGWTNGVLLALWKKYGD